MKGTVYQPAEAELVSGATYVYLSASVLYVNEGKSHQLEVLLIECELNVLFHTVSLGVHPGNHRTFL